MADRDPQISASQGAAHSMGRPGAHRPWLRPVLMISVPLALVAAGGAYYLANDHYVSTDNAYVQQDKVSVSAEVTGKIVDVLVRENQPVKAGQILFRIDPAPYRIAAAQADATIAQAQVRVTTLEADFQSRGVDIAKAREAVAFYTKEYQRQSALMQTGFTTKRPSTPCRKRAANWPRLRRRRKRHVLLWRRGLPRLASIRKCWPAKCKSKRPCLICRAPSSARLWTGW